ncbi:Uncharacterised protein [Klebsiella pneumoniae]|nr:Uncharacterised protein [Klebsiella pneumoniae]
MFILTATHHLKNNIHFPEPLRLWSFIHQSDAIDHEKNPSLADYRPSTHLM